MQYELKKKKFNVILTTYGKTFYYLLFIFLFLFLFFILFYFLFFIFLFFLKGIVGGKKDKYFLRKMDFSYLVLDEAQKVKNSTSILHQSLLKFKSDHRLLLTGTPYFSKSILI